jgi:hypothetical protein
MRTTKGRAALAVLALTTTVVAGTARPAGAEPGVRDVTAQLDPGRAHLGWVGETYQGIPVVHDWNRDGRADVIVPTHNKHAWPVLFGEPGGGFRHAYDLPRADRHNCAVWDFAGPHGGPDGLDDLYCVLGADNGTSNTKTNELFLGTPDGRFHRGAGGVIYNHAAERGLADRSGRGFVAAALDFKRNGRPVLFSGTNPGNVFPSPDRMWVEQDGRPGQYRQRRTQLLPAEQNTDCAAVGDVDGDGWDDLLTCSRTTRLHYNLAGVGFADRRAAAGLPSSMFWLRDAALADVNGDGRVDLLAVTKSRFEVRLNRGAWPMFPTADFTAALRNGHGVCTGDADGDGDRDVLVVDGAFSQTERQAPDALFVNHGGGGQGWSRLAVPQPPDVRPGEWNGDGDRCASVPRPGGDLFLIGNGWTRWGHRQAVELAR